MKSFNQFYISSKRMFWVINLSFPIAVVLLIGYLFGFNLRGVYLQLAIALPMTVLVIWLLGGYRKIKADYLQRQKNQVLKG